MSGLWTIARREFIAQFVSPVGYLVWMVFAVLVGAWFVQILIPGQAASMRPVYGTLVSMLVFITPAISMRLISEELKTNTIELLMTAPVTDAQVVIGKWLGAVGFLCVLLSPILVAIGVLEMVADPDYGPLISGLVGMLLVGAMFLAIGTCVSTATDSQVTAYLVTTLFTGFLTYGMTALYLAKAVPAELKPIFLHLNTGNQYSDFAKGLIDLRLLVYFTSLTALFLFIGIKLLESKRWR